MLFRLSAKLGAYLHIRPKEMLPLAPNPLVDWSAHIFPGIGGRYFILTNTASLYSVVIPGQGISGAAGFLDLAAAAMWHYMRADGFEPIFQRAIAPVLEVVQYSEALNRGVIGSMNDMVWLTQSLMADGERSLVEIARFLNHTPMSYLDGHGHPKEAFARLGGMEAPAPKDRLSVNR